MTRMNANDLRRVAEHADGFRGQVLRLDEYLVDEYDSDLKLKVEKGYKGQHAHVEVETPDIGRSFRPLDFVAVFVNKELKHVFTSPKDPTVDDVDSLFWTQAAAQKFLIPYYAGFSNRHEMEVLYQACANQLPDKDIYAIGHRYPTIYDPYGGGGPPGGGGGGIYGALDSVAVVWSFERAHDVSLTTLRQCRQATRQSRESGERAPSAT